MAGRSRARQYLFGDRDAGALREAATDPNADASHGLREDLIATWRLVRAYLRGEYRAVRLRSVLSVLGGIVYFLSPIDVIPDVFLLVGYTDDVVVVSLVFSVLRQELLGFRAWEQQRHGHLDATVLHTVRDG
jgi:uncharacterized membrane protein YkvA (DUF1232 family)